MPMMIEQYGGRRQRVDRRYQVRHGPRGGQDKHRDTSYFRTSPFAMMSYCFWCVFGHSVELWDMDAR